MTEGIMQQLNFFSKCLFCLVLFEPAFGIELSGEKALGASAEEIRDGINVAGNTITGEAMDTQDKTVMIMYNESTLDMDFRSLFVFRGGKAFAKIMLHCVSPDSLTSDESEENSPRKKIVKLLKRKYGAPTKVTTDHQHWTNGKTHIFFEFSEHYGNECTTDFALAYSTVAYSTFDNYLNAARQKFKDRVKRDKAAAEKKQIDEDYKKHKDEL